MIDGKETWRCDCGSLPFVTQTHCGLCGEEREVALSITRYRELEAAKTQRDVFREALRRIQSHYSSLASPHRPQDVSEKELIAWYQAEARDAADRVSELLQAAPEPREE